jgi:hypothetical protein
LYACKTAAKIPVSAPSSGAYISFSLPPFAIERSWSEKFGIFVDQIFVSFLLPSIFALP